jgi:hypothetical protein
MTVQATLRIKKQRVLQEIRACVQKVSLRRWTIYKSDALKLMMTADGHRTLNNDFSFILVQSHFLRNPATPHRETKSEKVMRF